MSEFLHPRLANLILEIWDEGLRMRADGATREAMQEHWRDRLVTAAHARRMVLKDDDLPPWFLRKCFACKDSGWEVTTRLVRGELVEAYERCTCRPMGMSDRQDDRQAAVDKVASGWKQVGRR